MGIPTPLKSLEVRRLLDVLGDIFKVRFEEQKFGSKAAVDAWFFPEANWETRRQISRCEQPCYCVVHPDERIVCGGSSIIKFSRHPALPSRLSGREIRTNESVNLMALPQQEGMTALATKSGLPVWAIDQDKRQQHHYVTLDIGELDHQECVFQHFNGRKFLQLLPLIVFLKTLVCEEEWEPPPLQACFMFDDPNLHWKRYGFIDFEKLADHARMNNYHVSFATIPLDSWCFHKQAAFLFQKNRDQLSLLIHGNDHTAEELARPFSDVERENTLRQALNRIEKFERRSGVEVSRVMIPPHGAINASSLRIMAWLGFEAACVSSGSLRRYNERSEWLRRVGMSPSDIIAGLPVFSRFALSDDYQNTILIAAILHQPIIMRGHHYDVSNGLSLLGDIAEFVNSLGEVTWSDMKGISRSHYLRKFDGENLRVRMLTRRMELIVPKNICKISVEWPMLELTEASAVLWRLAGIEPENTFQRFDTEIPVIAGQRIEIATELMVKPSVEIYRRRNIQVWPVVRRQFTETRDRFAPVKRRVGMVFVRSYGRVRSTGERK